MRYKISIGRKILERTWVLVECDNEDQIEGLAKKAAETKDWERYDISYSGMSVKPENGEPFDILIDM